MNVKINFAEVLSKAWRIVWKFKVLWIFGILAGCSTGNGGRFNSNYSGGGSGSGNGSGSSGTDQFSQFFDNLDKMRPEQAVQNFLGQYGAIIAIVIVLLCVIWVIFYFLGVMGRTGLIKGASQADAGAESLSFDVLWAESTPYFWRMFGLNMLVGLPFFILIVILLAGLGFGGYSAFKSGLPTGGMSVMLIGLMGTFFAAMCAISILSIVVSMIVEQAQNAIVLDDLGVLEGFSRGWAVLKSAVVTIVLMAIILGIIGWVISLLIALPILVIAVPTVIGVVATDGNNYILPLLIAGGCFVIYLPFLLVFSGVFQAYNQSVWTLVYRRLTAPPAPEVLTVSPAE
jgi:hypothetical protein